MPSTSTAASGARRCGWRSAVAAPGTAGGAERAGSVPVTTVGACAVVLPVSACPNCAALEKRSAGTAASAFRMAWSTPSETLVRTARTLGAGSVSRRASIAWVVAPVYGASPASIS